MSETWSEIEGFPGYAVSTKGRVMNTKLNRVLQPRSDSYGYQRVTLYSRPNDASERYVHRLVASAFIEGYSSGIRVRHKDENRANNRVENLIVPVHGTLIGDPTISTVRKVRVVELGMVFRTIEDCASYIGTSTSSIYRVLRGDRGHHRGHTFEYVEELNDRVD